MGNVRIIFVTVFFRNSGEHKQELSLGFSTFFCAFLSVRTACRVFRGGGHLISSKVTST